MDLEMSREKSPTKDTHTTHNSSFYTNVSNCIICLDKVRCRGKLSVCKHWFCFRCILEWSKNTNTCPVCKSRFRSISKVHLSPLRSPPTKVQVPDREQRVWNDDDDEIPEDLLYDIQNEMREDMDDDYEPPYQDNLDEYDLEDSFIDDTNQPSSYAMERLILTVDFEDEEGLTTITRDRPYFLRRRQGLRSAGARGNEVTLDTSALDNIEEQGTFEDITSSESDDSSFTDGSSSDVDEEDSESSEQENAFYLSSRRRNKTCTHPPARNTRSQASTKRSLRSRAPERSTRTEFSERRTRSKTTGRNLRTNIPERTRSPNPARSTRSQAPSRRTRYQARVQMEQARNERLREDRLIAQSIQQTGSSGWLSTRTTNGREAAILANHDRSTRRTQENREETMHSRNRDNTECIEDDDTYDNDKNAHVLNIDPPALETKARARQGSQGRPTTSGFSRIRVAPTSDSEDSDNVLLISTAQTTAQRNSLTRRESKDPSPLRNTGCYLLRSPHAVENDTCKPEVKKWKRIRTGNEKENRPILQTILTQNASGEASYDTELNRSLSNELSSKTSKRNSNSNEIDHKRQKSSIKSGITRTQIQCLENSNSCEKNLTSTSSSLQSSSLFGMGIRDRYTLRQHRKRDDDDDDNIDGENDVNKGGKKRRGAVVRMSHDYEDDTDNENKKCVDKKKGKSLVSSHDDDDDDNNGRYIGKRKRTGARVKMPQDYKDDSEDDTEEDTDDDKNGVHIGKRKRTGTRVKMPQDYKDNTDDDTDNDTDDDNKNGVLTGKRKIPGARVKMLQDYGNDTDDDDDDDDDDNCKKKNKQVLVSRPRDNNDMKHIKKRHGSKVRMPHDYEDDYNDDEVNKKHVDKERKGESLTSRSCFDDDCDGGNNMEHTGERKRHGARMSHHHEDDTGDDNKMFHYRKKAHARDSTLQDNYDMVHIKRNIATARTSHEYEDDTDKYTDMEKRKAFVDTWSDECNVDSSDGYFINSEDELSNIIMPTPQPDKKRSMFTRRQHRKIYEQCRDSSVNCQE